MKPAERNIVLIGMPGVGKSTTGVILAKRLNLNFIDTDIHIQQQTGRSLQDLIADMGVQNFCKLEADLVAKLAVRKHVIATGGSVVYGVNAMEQLKNNGLVLWLDLPYPQLAERLNDLDARGVVMEPGQSLEQLYNYRRPFYAKYADLRLDTDTLNIDKAVTLMADYINSRN